MYIDHADIVTSHACNMRCPFCVDKFRELSPYCAERHDNEVKLDDIARFLDILRKHTDRRTEILLLGGEPTCLEEGKLIDIANLIRDRGFSPVMSTNGILRDKIVHLTKYYDWIQVTVRSDAQIDFYRKYLDRINIKFAGDQTCTYERLRHLMDYTKGFVRRSVSMYSTPDFVECCTDKKVWDMISGSDVKWDRNGSYMYTFIEGVRFKKFIKGETNIIDEPTVPKLYPSGVYNKTWNNEDSDPYLG